MRGSVRVAAAMFGVGLADFAGFFGRLLDGLGGGGFAFRGLQGFELDLGADDGEESVDAGANAEGEEGGDDLVDGVAFDDAAAVKAGDGAAAGVEEAEVVVDLRGGGYGGAGVAGLVLLLDGDGGGEAVHVVYIGFLDALEELAGVGGEGFDVAALAFCVDGVEGEGGFAGARDAGDDGEGVVGDVDVDGLKVVGAGSADGDLVEGCGGDGLSEKYEGRVGSGHTLLSARLGLVARGARMRPHL